MKVVHEILRANLNSTLYEYGFADLRGLLQTPYSRFPFGISLLRHLDPAIIDSIANGPTRAYFDHYYAINRELNQVVNQIAQDLTDAGFPSEGVRATVEEGELCRETLTYPVSQKLVATRAGLGWIGKTDLLISKRFGPKIRLASILTTHPLQAATPINESQCGTCSLCVTTCPAAAANGKRWDTTVHRNDFFDPFKCRNYCRKITRETLGEELSLCGKCVYVCPRGKPAN